MIIMLKQGTFVFITILPAIYSFKKEYYDRSLKNSNIDEIR